MTPKRLHEQRTELRITLIGLSSLLRNIDAAPSNGAQIAVFASYNLLDETVDTELASLIKNEGYTRVTYKARGPTWFALSGLRSIARREQVFYEKYLFGAAGKTIHAVVVTYPAELKAIYDPLVGRIGSSP